MKAGGLGLFRSPEGVIGTSSKKKKNEKNEKRNNKTPEKERKKKILLSIFCVHFFLPFLLFLSSNFLLAASVYFAKYR